MCVGRPVRNQRRERPGCRELGAVAQSEPDFLDTYATLISNRVMITFLFVGSELAHETPTERAILSISMKG